MLFKLFQNNSQFKIARIKYKIFNKAKLWKKTKMFSKISKIKMSNKEI